MSAIDTPLTAAPLGEDAATIALATLGYPGFAYRRRRQGLNPAELLLRALKTSDLDARVPWSGWHFFS